MLPQPPYPSPVLEGLQTSNSSPSGSPPSYAEALAETSPQRAATEGINNISLNNVNLDLLSTSPLNQQDVNTVFGVNLSDTSVVTMNEIDDVLKHLDDIPMSDLMTSADATTANNRLDIAVFMRKVLKARKLIRRAREELNRALDVTDEIVDERD